MIHNLYQKWILQYPRIVLIVLFALILSFGININKLEIDASSETLLLEDDTDLAFSRTIEKRFQANDVLILVYKPHSPLLSAESLQTITDIGRDLEILPKVSSVDSIMNVPLLFSPVRDADSLIHDTRTLQNKDINLTLVKQEFLTSPLYKDRLVNKEFTLTSILINLYPDHNYTDLLEKRNTLRLKKNTSSLSSEEQEELEKVSNSFKQYRDEQRIVESSNIRQIRSIMQKYKETGTFFLGGVSMISNDIVGFVKNDLVTYGSILVLLLILILGFVFRKPRWIVLPIVICTLSVMAITSSLGFFGWEITVISSNFIALQLIITISVVLHLIVRYEELLSLYPHASHKRIILLTVLSKINPTFFAIITTIAGFSSLLFAHIKPVINLGWMMSVGIAMSFVISFIVFPTVLMLLKKTPPRKQIKHRFNLPFLSSQIVLYDKKAIYIVTFLMVLFSLSGASKLIVENSFINYFKKDTSIYQGMKIIDQELGGTTPLDVILTFKENNQTSVEINENIEYAFENEFEEEFNDEAHSEKYWFTDEKLTIIRKIHNYLSQLGQIGNVQSFATLLETGKRLNNGKDLDSVELAILYEKLPQKYRESILTPYINITHNQARFSMRIMDSNEGLRRNILLKKIHTDLNQMIDKDIVNIKLSNLMVLYNNMLQSLFTSQITTLSYVLLILISMFYIIFRSWKLTMIAFIANAIPISIIFGFMGWFHIPLDIMTITIAAIAMGIGVDDTIHYIHRFQKEYVKDHDYQKAMQRSNLSIGHAMYYTTLTITIGFSILVLSNLIPTIYFGILTMIVMIAALIADLILLPKLLLNFKPFTLGK